MFCQDMGGDVTWKDFLPCFSLCFKSKTPPNNTGKKLGAKVTEQDLGNKYWALL